MTSFRPLVVFRLVWIGCLWLSLSACSQLPVEFDFQPDAVASGAADREIWPPPPDTPRYRYFGQLLGEENIVTVGEESRSVIEKAFRWLVGMDNYPEEPVILQRPQAGAVGEDGRIYVSDVSRQGIYVFDPAGVQLSVWEHAAEGVRFQLPIGVAIRGDRVLVADAALGYVAVLGGDGVPQGSIGKGLLNHPTGVAWDGGSKRVFVADRGDNNIKVFGDDGGLLFSFGEFGEEKGQLNGPTYLAWHDQQLYVTDTLNSRIQVFSPDGDFVRTFGQRGMYIGNLPRPKGVAVDRDGNVYVVESYYDYLLVFDREGQFLLPIGGSGNRIGQFYLPAGVWTDASNRIYVADMFNGRVVIFEYLGDGDESDVAEDNSAHLGRTAGDR